MLDGPRSNMVNYCVVWLVPFLTMLGDSFLTWLDLGYCLLGDGGSFANYVRRFSFLT